jgi:hypothetical protein
LHAYGNPPPDLADLAAALAYGLARTQSFTDGKLTERGFAAWLRERLRVDVQRDVHEPRRRYRVKRATKIVKSLDPKGAREKKGLAAKESKGTKG